MMQSREKQAIENSDCNELEGKECIGDPEDPGKVAVAKLVTIAGLLEEWRSLGAIAEERRAYDYLVKIERVICGKVQG